MKSATIQTLHPEAGKKNKVISCEKYEAVKNSILKALQKNQLNHTELLQQVAVELSGQFEGNTNWYTETVKLDLEARHIIERTNDKPQKYRLKKQPN